MGTHILLPIGTLGDFVRDLSNPYGYRIDDLGISANIWTDNSDATYQNATGPNLGVVAQLQNYTGGRIAGVEVHARVSLNDPLLPGGFTPSWLMSPVSGDYTTSYLQATDAIPDPLAADGSIQDVVMVADMTGLSEADLDLLTAQLAADTYITFAFGNGTHMDIYEMFVVVAEAEAGGVFPLRRWPAVNNGGTGPTRHWPRTGARHAGGTY
jgi:hypothetical protein